MFIVIIPARYASTRLPGKPLADIHGQIMIVRVMRQAIKSGAFRVIIATDHRDVFSAIVEAGGEACMTNVNHQSGTERLAEVINIYGFSDNEIIVNVQGDEPLIPPEIISQVAHNLQVNNAQMGTLAVKIRHPSEIFDQNIVKVVTDHAGYALYFSRATIPWNRDEFVLRKKTISNYFLRHIGIYAYRAGFIRRYVTWNVSPLEKIEMLEQLRVLWYGEKIHVDLAKKIPGIGVNTSKDLDIVRKLFT
ncbi:3-deoxy-manno-octulosonate cytidylyltransferase [Candidatus Hartigia pinicola]|nr:3-deoxy-manno-octulosonate cytidylyltransferase [Candidatus Hartigia pinicola]